MVHSTINLDPFALPSSGGRSHSGCGGCGTGRSVADGQRCGNGLEKIYPTTAVRFGYMRYVGEFTHQPDMKFTCGAKVVIQTKRGIEMGDQVSQTCSGCDKAVTREEMRTWVKTCGNDSFFFSAGRILREATASDLAEYTRIQAGGRERRIFAQEAAKQRKLSLQVVDCESLFGGERIIFFFTATERVDFRLLVKDLAQEYRTRIEMRQVGARDEARLLADFETCGREVCCKVFLKTLRPVSMRMAKVQKATLDPSQVSGRCGRLKCCLRYEHTSYEELDKKLPRTGVRIRTNHGEGVIVNRQILTQLVQIRTDTNELITVVAEDITEVGVAPPPPQDTSKKTPGAEKRGDRGRPRHATSKRRMQGNRTTESGREKPSQPQPKPTDKDSSPEASSSSSRPSPSRRSRRRRGRRNRRSEENPGKGGSEGSDRPDP